MHFKQLLSSVDSPKYLHYLKVSVQHFPEAHADFRSSALNNFSAATSERCSHNINVPSSDPLHLPNSTTLQRNQPATLGCGTDHRTRQYFYHLFCYGDGSMSPAVEDNAVTPDFRWHH